MKLSLRQRILWWSVFSTLVVLLTVLFFVDRSFRGTIRSGLEENVEAGIRLASELFASEVDDGVLRNAELARSPTLRAAVETGDAATIDQNLDGLLYGSEAAWMAVTTVDGRVLATAGSASRGRIESARSLIQEARFYPTADLWREGSSIVEVRAAGIYFGPTPIGILLSGDPIGADRIERLERSTQQQVAMISGNRLVAGGEELSAAEREALVVAWSAAEGGDSASSAERMIREFALDGGTFLGAALPLLSFPTADGAVLGHLVAYRSLQAAEAPARNLRFALLGITGGSILLAFVFSVVLARRVTGPVSRLLRETVRLGSGDLEHPVKPERDDEIGRLAEGFEAMRTSLLQARTELIRAERLSAVGRAASAIVHDFSQPVSVIQGNIELLEEEWEDEAARQEDVGVIRRELRRLTSMMHEILDFARGEDRIQSTTESVGEFMEDIEDRFRKDLDSRDVTLETEPGYREEWRLDFPRTTRVIENLIRNAASAIGAGGTIRLRSVLAKDHLQLRVEDDGPGIPPELRENLFDPFVTLGKEKGTGLGLAIARSFTERQGGSIRYETSEGGTTFILEFPMVEDPA